MGFNFPRLVCFKNTCISLYELKGHNNPNKSIMIIDKICKQIINDRGQCLVSELYTI